MKLVIKPGIVILPTESISIHVLENIPVLILNHWEIQPEININNRDKLKAKQVKSDMDITTNKADMFSTIHKNPCNLCEYVSYHVQFI